MYPKWACPDNIFLPLLWPFSFMDMQQIKLVDLNFKLNDDKRIGMKTMVEVRGHYEINLFLCELGLWREEPLY